MRKAKLAIYCEVVDCGIGRNAIFPIDVAIGDDEPVSSKELARSIRAAAAFLGIAPYEMSTAMLQQLREETEHFRTVLAGLRITGEL